MFTFLEPIRRDNLVTSAGRICDGDLSGFRTRFCESLFRKP